VSSRLIPSGDGVEVVFEVAEGPPTVVASLEILQDSALLAPDALQRASFPAVDELLDMVRLRAGAEALRRVLLDRGFANAVVEDSVVVEAAADSTSARRAHVTLHVRPESLVTIDGFVVQGNDKVSDRTILRAVGLQSESVFRQDELEEARRRLYRSALFQQSLITTIEDAPELAEVVAQQAEVQGAQPDPAAPPLPEPEPGDTTRTILVIVQEAPFDEVALGIGMTTLEFGQAQGRYTRHNLFGGARRLDVSLSVGNLFARSLHERGLFRDATPAGVFGEVESGFLDPTWRASIDFTQPWLRTTANALGIGFFAHRRTVPGIVIDESVGARASFSRVLARGVTAGLTYRFERTQTTAGDVYFCVNFGVCSFSTIEALQQSRSLSPVTLSLDVERVDRPDDPLAGFNAHAEASHASTSTASDYGYNAASANGAYFRPLGSGTLALRVRGGVVRSTGGSQAALAVADEGTSILHPRTRLYAGGSRSVRGYGENQLGPRILTVPATALIDAEVCTEESIADRTCDPNGLPARAFQPRPLGGNGVLEASIEYRIPIGDAFGAAIFVDVGHVDDLDLNIPSGAASAVTPGVGIRYRSRVGMVRVDLGVRPRLVENLPVITAIGDGEERRLVRLETPLRYDPVGRGGSFASEVYRRLVLHLSIGETF
jgi:outer membrane protein insertion porin family/translocation and assembly module TamA